MYLNCQAAASLIPIRDSSEPVFENKKFKNISVTTPNYKFILEQRFQNLLLKIKMIPDNKVIVICELKHKNR